MRAKSEQIIIITKQKFHTHTHKTRYSKQNRRYLNEQTKQNKKKNQRNHNNKI